MTMANLVLLAENRLSLPTENRVTALRIGFFAQILLISGWFLTYINEPRARNRPRSQISAWSNTAAVAMFTVTEDLIVPRRALLQMQRPSRWRWLLAVFGPAADAARPTCWRIWPSFLPRPDLRSAGDALALAGGDLRLYLPVHRRAHARVRVVRPARPASAAALAPARCCCCRSRCCCPTSSITSCGRLTCSSSNTPPVI